MSCSWAKEDYFSQLMSTDKQANGALEMLVDDLHSEKDKTVSKFLSHSGSEDFLWGLVRLLGNDVPRVAGNSAYIIGTLAESELGCIRVLSLAKDGSRESKQILPDLTQMLTFDDSESVMNAAGTMGTLAESHEGREWILGEPCLQQTLNHITALLHSENLWTASNAALVLARLSISEVGCTRILQHEHSQHILSKLVLSLGVDEAVKDGKDSYSRGMNAAFAIGRLCDMESGRKRLLQLSDSERMISSLAKMLSCDDTGASKNACFALSCLATNSEGHTRLLRNIHSDEILRTLSHLLNADDSETGWFAAMTLRTLASQPKGCLRLRDHPSVVPALKVVDDNSDVNVDLREEALITLDILKRLAKPHPPTIEVVGPDCIKASWDKVVTKCGFPVRYQLFDSTKCVFTGKECECNVTSLLANTSYTYKLRAYTEGDESPFSESVTVTTDESEPKQTPKPIVSVSNVPGPPQCVRILGSTITQLKVGWDPPEDLNGVLKCYYVSIEKEDKVFEHHATENNLILTGLTANTTYEILVCASTVRGRGEKGSCLGTTSETGAHAPGKPHINVIGRNELHISWTAPEVPVGRFNRYDVYMNDKIIYSGVELNLPVRRLTPDTEYAFVIVALTSDGKFESRQTKKRTARDEYDTARPPLYQPPRRESIDEGSKASTVTPTVAKKKKLNSASRVSSAKNSNKRPSAGKERAKSSTSDARPISATSSVVSARESTHDIAEKRLSPPSPVPQSHDNTPPTQASTSQRVGGTPVAEVKHETPTSVSKHLPKNAQLSFSKLEKIPSVGKIAPSSLPVSNVSMQNHQVDTTKDHTDKHKDSVVPSISNSLKLERSKTIGAIKEPKRNKYSSSKTNNDTLLSDVWRRSAHKQKGALADKSSHLNKLKAAEPDTKHDLLISSAEKVNVRRSSLDLGDRMRAMPRDHVKLEKQDLPKPSPPSQMYLEGKEGSVHDGPRGNRSTIPSPRSLRDVGLPADSHESDWLTQVKRVSESYLQGVHPPNLSPPHPDSSYFIDPPALHRTNTYINSHRPGRRALEKVPKPAALGKVAMPLKVGQSINFEAEIPDHNTSKLSNKFIPMQLRTQPANLGVGQLQRVNTTLLGDISAGDSIQFRRVDAFTRSQTQLDVTARPHHGLPAPAGPLIDPGIARRDVGLLMSSSKPRDRRNSPRRKSLSGSSQKTHKLGGTGAAHHKEPDSMLLQQSWGLGGPQEGALQNVR